MRRWLMWREWGGGWGRRRWLGWGRMMWVFFFFPVLVFILIGGGCLGAVGGWANDWCGCRCYLLRLVDEECIVADLATAGGPLERKNVEYIAGASPRGVLADASFKEVTSYGRRGRREPFIPRISATFGFTTILVL